MSYIQPDKISWPASAGYRYMERKPLDRQVFVDIMRKCYPGHHDKANSSRWPGVAILKATGSIEAGFQEYWDSLEFRDPQAGVRVSNRDGMIHMYDAVGCVATSLDSASGAVRALHTVRGVEEAPETVDKVIDDIERGRVSDVEKELLVDRNGTIHVTPADMVGMFLTWCDAHKCRESARPILAYVSERYHTHSFETTMSVLGRFMEHGFEIQHSLELLDYGCRTAKSLARSDRHLEQLAGVTDVHALESLIHQTTLSPAAQARATRAYMAVVNTTARATASPTRGL